MLAVFIARAVRNKELIRVLCARFLEQRVKIKAVRARTVCCIQSDDLHAGCRQCIDLLHRRRDIYITVVIYALDDADDRQVNFLFDVHNILAGIGTDAHSTALFCGKCKVAHKVVAVKRLIRQRLARDNYAAMDLVQNFLICHKNASFRF